jgi:hypothetical protein
MSSRKNGVPKTAAEEELLRVDLELRQLLAEYTDSVHLNDRLTQEIELREEEIFTKEQSLEKLREKDSAEEAYIELVSVVCRMALKSWRICVFVACSDRISPPSPALPSPALPPPESPPPAVCHAMLNVGAAVNQRQVCLRDQGQAADPKLHGGKIRQVHTYMPPMSYPYYPYASYDA